MRVPSGRTATTFALAYDRRNNLLLASFSGILDGESFALFDEAALVFLAAEGPASAVLDFTGVTEVALDADYAIERARQPPLFPDHSRIVVAPQQAITALAHIFAEHQSQAGFPPPTIVRTLEEAVQRAGVRKPGFRSVPTSAFIPAMGVEGHIR